MSEKNKSTTLNSISLWVFFISLCCLNALLWNGIANIKTTAKQEIKISLRTQEIILQKQEDNPSNTVLQKKEMRNTIVLVRINFGNGSGTIIDCLETELDGVSEYRILTNAHITSRRLISDSVVFDYITGETTLEEVDFGCSVIVFDHQNEDWHEYSAKVLLESTELDLAILSFESSREFDVAKTANQKMMSDIDVFDEVFAVGCQLGKAPIPTTGIISQIFTQNNNGSEIVIYRNTACISPGSSGGGLFKEYYDHYYLIGIPYSVGVANNSQFVPHMSYSISIITAMDFINSSQVSTK